MKRLFWIMLLNIIFSTSVLARDENSFYIKANVGANWMNDTKDEEVILKSKAAAFLSFGWGFFIMEKIRTDFTVEKIINQTSKGSGKVKESGVELNASIKQWSEIGALMVNAYFDIFDSNIIGIFAGGGIGASLVKTGADIIIIAPNNTKIKEFSSTDYKLNFAYQFTMGAFKEVSEGINAEISYSWRKYGRAGKIKNTDIYSDTSYKGHNIIAGIRFDL